MTRSVAWNIRRATHWRARCRGLLGTARLDDGEGLWLRPCKAIHTCGMRFRIDLIFVDRSGRIVRIDRGVPPGRFRWCWRAHSVVEIAGGMAEQAGLRIGVRWP